MTSTGLKLLALALMLVDHIGEFIPGAPIWLRWIGRLSAPIFFFCAGRGLEHTRDRRKYLLRLYICGVGMGALGLLCNNALAQPSTYVTNNIFVTIFSFGLIVTLIEYWLKNKKRGTVFILIYVVFQIAAAKLCVASAGSGLVGFYMFTASLLGSVLYCEGGMIWTLMGVALYFAGKSKKALSVVYLLFSAYFLWEAYNIAGWNTVAIFYQDFQWMMVLSLPFMLLYNGKKGAGLKYLFYGFYPLHIAALFFLGNALA